MKIGIHTWGSEGDVRPFLMLADGLVQAGHEVRLAYVPVDGRDYAPRLTTAPYEHRRIEPAQAPEDLRPMGADVYSSSNWQQLSRVIEESLEPAIEEMTQSARELARWADVLVLHHFAHPLSAAAEAEHKPFACVYLGPPGIPTKAFPPTGLPSVGILNSLAWKLALRAFSGLFIDSVNRARQLLGLRAVQRMEQQLDRSTIDLVAMSPTLLPRPPEWPKKVHLSGSLSPPPAPATPLCAALEAFLADGPPPVYVTFGSMSGLEQDPCVVVDIIERAVAAVGCRAIVQSEVPGSSSPQVLRVSGPVAHDQVFPRCSAIVHHGGVGTTQAALRAGRPSVIVAHILDQFMWGRQLHGLGVAPPHLSRKRLAWKPLARAIERATQDAAMQATAERLRAQMLAEDGVREAVELISRLQPPCAARQPSQLPASA